MNVRSRRVVAKQINTGREQGLFAATPPLEALRLLLSGTVTPDMPKVLMLNDMSRVHVYWSCVRRTRHNWEMTTGAEAHKVSAWNQGSRP